MKQSQPQLQPHSEWVDFKRGRPKVAAYKASSSMHMTFLQQSPGKCMAKAEVKAWEVDDYASEVSHTMLWLSNSSPWSYHGQHQVQVCLTEVINDEQTESFSFTKGITLVFSFQHIIRQGHPYDPCLYTNDLSVNTAFLDATAFLVAEYQQHQNKK